MKEFKENLKNLFDENFTGEFIRDMIYQTKMSLIDAELFCDDVVNIADESCTRDYRIEKASAIKRCNRKVFRNLDLYVFLQDALIDDEIIEETFEINEFVKEIAENCAKYTEFKFPVQKKEVERTYIKLNKNFTVFIILMQVRNAFIKGARSVRFNYAVDEKFVTLSLKFRKSKRENPFSSLEEDVMQRFLSEISDLLVTQIHSEISILEDGAVIKIPVYDRMELNAYKDKIIENKELYLYSVMLSEFSEYLFYK